MNVNGIAVILVATYRYGGDMSSNTKLTVEEIKEKYAEFKRRMENNGWGHVGDGVFQHKTTLKYFNANYKTYIWAKKYPVGEAWYYYYINDLLPQANDTHANRYSEATNA